MSAGKARKKELRIKLDPYLDKELQSSLLKTSRTAAKITAIIEKAEGLEVVPGKVSSLLTKYPCNKLVSTIFAE